MREIANICPAASTHQELLIKLLYFSGCRSDMLHIPDHRWNGLPVDAKAKAPNLLLDLAIHCDEIAGPVLHTVDPFEVEAFVLKSKQIVSQGKSATPAQYSLSRSSSQAQNNSGRASSPRLGSFRRLPRKTGLAWHSSAYSQQPFWLQICLWNSGTTSRTHSTDQERLLNQGIQIALQCIPLAYEGERAEGERAGSVKGRQQPAAPEYSGKVNEQKGSRVESKPLHHSWTRSSHS